MRAKAYRRCAMAAFWLNTCWDAVRIWNATVAYVISPGNVQPINLKNTFNLKNFNLLIYFSTRPLSHMLYPERRIDNATHAAAALPFGWHRNAKSGFLYFNQINFLKACSAQHSLGWTWFMIDEKDLFHHQYMGSGLTICSWCNIPFLTIISIFQRYQSIKKQNHQNEFIKISKNNYRMLKVATHPLFNISIPAVHFADSFFEGQLISEAPHK